MFFERAPCCQCLFYLVRSALISRAPEPRVARSCLLVSAENSYYSRLVFVGGYVYFPYFNSGNVQSCAPEVFGRFSPYCLAFTIKIILCMSLYLQPFSTWPFEIIFSHRFSFIFFSTQIHRAPRLKCARYGDELECRTESAELQLAGEFLTLIVFGMFMRCLLCRCGVDQALRDSHRVRQMRVLQMYRLKEMHGQPHVLQVDLGSFQPATIRIVPRRKNSHSWYEIRSFIVSMTGTELKIRVRIPSLR